MSIVVVKQAGVAVPRIDTRVGEVITHTLECTELLDQHELIISAELVNPIPNVEVSNIRPRRGVSIELTVSPNPFEASQYEDHIVQVRFNTIKDNKKLAVFQLRVYK